MTRPLSRPAVTVATLLLLVSIVSGCQLSLDLFYDQHPAPITDVVEPPAKEEVAT